MNRPVQSHAAGKPRHRIASLESLECRVLLASVPISNPGFENPTLADGAWQATIPNWTLSLASDSTAGPWNPTASHFSPQAPEGSNVV